MDKTAKAQKGHAGAAGEGAMSEQQQKPTLRMFIEAMVNGLEDIIYDDELSPAEKLALYQQSMLTLADLEPCPINLFHRPDFRFVESAGIAPVLGRRKGRAETRCIG
jgi:hypothetical protein